MAPEPNASRRPGIGLRLAVVAIGLVAGFLALEGAVRLRQELKYGTVRNSVLSFTVDPTSGLAIPEPGSSTGAIHIDSRGFRSPEIEVPKPKDRIRIAFLGDSTSFCAEVGANEATWPHLVWRAVQDKRPDRRFDYVNAGVPGYSTEESLRNLETRVAPLEPDVIFIYHGSNDLSFDTRMLAHQQGLMEGKAEESGFLSRWSLAWYLLEKNFQLRARQSSAAAGTGRLEVDPKQLSAPFEQRLRALVAAAQKVAPVVVLGTFSHRARPEQSPDEQLRACNTSLYYMPYMSVAGLIASFSEYDRVIRSVAAGSGSVLVEVANEVPADPRYFADSIHFTDAGAQLVGELMAKGLLESEAFNTLLASRAPSPARADVASAAALPGEPQR